MSKISPTSDLGFKKILASPEHKNILQGFIQDFFEISVELGDITVINPYDIKAYTELANKDDVEKANVLRQTLRDVAASLRTKDFTCEMQLHKSTFFEARSLYYPLNQYCQNYNIEQELVKDETGRINKYSSLKPVYALNILGYNHFNGDDDALRIFEFYDPVRQKSMNKEFIKIGYFELHKDNIETERQRYWRDFFLTGTAPDNAPNYIKHASDIIDFVNLGEEERAMILTFEKAQATYDASLVDAYINGKEEGIEEGMEKGMEKGIEKGMEKGIEKGAELRDREIAQLMLQENSPVDFIMRITNLTKEQIEELRQ